MKHELSKDDIAAINDLKPGYTLGHADVAILKSAAALLAAHEQVPDYYVVLDNNVPYDVFGDEEKANLCAADASGLFSVKKLYTHPAPSIPAAVPDGYALVPVEPTEDMCFAPDVRVGNSTWDGYQSLADMHECKEIYKAMIAAAPKGVPSE